MDEGNRGEDSEEGGGDASVGSPGREIGEKRTPIWSAKSSDVLKTRPFLPSLTSSSRLYQHSQSQNGRGT